MNFVGGMDEYDDQFQLRGLSSKMRLGICESNLHFRLLDVIAVHWISFHLLCLIFWDSNLPRTLLLEVHGHNLAV